MDPGSAQTRYPPSPQAHPLVTSRSAPALPTAASTPGVDGRIERPLPDPPPPGPATRRVRQLHPAVAGTTCAPDAKRESTHESKQAEHRASPQDARPDADRGTAPGALVRFVGGFVLSPQPTLETENDALTVLADSIERSVQQQPDSGGPSSADATPRTRPATPRQPGEPD